MYFFVILLFLFLIFTLKTINFENFNVVNSSILYNDYRNYVDDNYRNICNVGFSMPYKVSNNCFIDKYDKCKFHFDSIYDPNAKQKCQKLSYDLCRFPGMISGKI